MKGGSTDKDSAAAQQDKKWEMGTNSYFLLCCKTPR